MTEKFNPTQSQLDAIADVPHFRDGQYARLHIAKTIDFFYRHYVEPVERSANLTADMVVADIGAGYGWLAMAWAIHTPMKVIAIDVDGERLVAAKKIADLLGLEKRIDWKVGGLGDLPLENQSIDVTCCIEVLEHVYGDEQAIRDLGRVSRKLILLTTPNRWFPIIAHDTRLPFCHWLPVPARKRYAALFGRTGTEIDNLFWSPSDLRRLLPDFSRTSGFMQFKDLDHYLRVFPYYLPYGRGRSVERIGTAKKLYFCIASRFRILVQAMLPNLASIYERK